MDFTIMYGNKIVKLTQHKTRKFSNSKLNSFQLEVFYLP